MKNKLPRLSFALLLGLSLPLIAHNKLVTAANDPYAVVPSSPTTVPTVLVAAPAITTPPTATEAAVSAGKKPVGDELITQASAQLEQRISIAARLRHQTMLPGKPLIYGIGSYWQQGTGEGLRVRLELQIAGQEASVLQVSDSRFLWVERRLPIGRSVTRLDLRQLRADTLLSGSQLSELQPGNINWMSAQSDLISHSGGLPSMLWALSENFTFLPPQPMRVAAEGESGKQTTSMPYFAVVGHWRPERLARLLRPVVTTETPTDGNSPINTAKLPERLPEEILILFGQTDLFPYRIEYRKLETPIAANQAGAAIPYQLSSRPMVVLEFTDVRFDIPTDTGQFIYTPGDTEWVDQTTAVLEKLRHKRNEQIAGRTAAPVK